MHVFPFKGRYDDRYSIFLKLRERTQEYGGRVIMILYGNLRRRVRSKTMSNDEIFRSKIYAACKGNLICSIPKNVVL